MEFTQIVCCIKLYRSLSVGRCVVCSVDVDSLDAAMAQDPSVFDVSHLSDKMLIEESGKVVFLIDLLDNLRAEKHRCLVFSSSRRMLDIVEKVMANKVRHVSVVHIHVHIHLLWSPYGIGQTIIFSCCGLLWSPYVIGRPYIFSCCFFFLLSSSSFFFLA